MNPAAKARATRTDENSAGEPKLFAAAVNSRGVFLRRWAQNEGVGNCKITIAGVVILLIYIYAIYNVKV